MKVAHVSTFPKIKCGIAFYVSDLIDSISAMDHTKYALHYGDNVTADAISHADVSNVSQLKRLAREISESDCDVISLQHEFGIWGGTNGEHIFDFLDSIKKPIVSTLHTTFRLNDRPAIEISILRRLIDQSVVNIVLTNRSKETLCQALGIPLEIISVIPHGVPNIAFIPSPERLHGTQVWRLCSIGFFRPDKGVEETLNALALLRKNGVCIYYVIAGSSQSQFDGQNEYLKYLQNRIIELDLRDSVIIDNRFLTRNEQIKLIQNSHAGVFAYQTPFQCSSGTIPLVMSAGRPVICTPFEFAEAKKDECGESVLIARNFGSEAIAEAIQKCFETEQIYRFRVSNLQGSTSQWHWQAVGRLYGLEFERAKSQKLGVVQV